MLPKKERLTRTDFNRFFVVGKRYHSPTLQVVYAPHPTFHASVVVSKKIAKTAVLRNKIRRQIYAILSRQRNERSPRGVYIVVTRPGVTQKTYAELSAELTHTLTKIPLD